MNLYDRRADKDHPFEPILIACRDLVPDDDEDFPHFKSQRKESDATPNH